MRGRAALLLALYAVAPAASEWKLQRQPTVVYEGRNVVAAQPYYRRLERSTSAFTTLDAPKGAGVKAIEHQLPLTSTRLRPGTPALKTQVGLVSPLFILGMDPVSLDWFAKTAEGLADIGAMGVVVQAATLSDWQRLQRQAFDVGIRMQLMSGDSLADAYQIQTYPVVIVSPRLASEGLGE